MKIKSVLILLFFLYGLLALAQFPPDQPAPDENFKSFFARITHGGSFPGIRVDAPVAFQKEFNKKIYRPFWMGALNKAQRQITDLGGDLWFDLYKTEKIGDWLFPTSNLKKIFELSYNENLKSSAQCQSHCRNWAELSAMSFSIWNTAERELFALTYVTTAKLFDNKTVADYLATRYDLSAKDLLGRFRFGLLNAADFETAVRELGWTGEIYFRGITAPDPKNPRVSVILMNEDLMQLNTPFDAPLLKCLEYVGILTHELSHVFQNIEGTQLGIDLQIYSAESALLVEGQAEWQAESALTAAGLTWKDAPQSLQLFVAESAVEIVNRPGNEQQGNLFPYTVGLPFAAALETLQANSLSTRYEVYNTIILKQSLSQFLTKMTTDLTGQN